MNRIEEIKKRIENNDNVLLMDKHEFDSLKKITKSIDVDNYEVLTDSGFVSVKALHETIPYEVYELKLSDNKTLKCADNHIVFDELYNEIFVKDLNIGDVILVDNDDNYAYVTEINNLGYEEVMFDLELGDKSNHRYYTNGVLSHNTHLTKKLAEYVYGDAEALIRFDMSEFMEKHSVSKLAGAPPGYTGYEEGGQLTEKVRKKPYSIILLDEIEKAHEDIFNILLQVLDEGHLTDGLGRKVNFKNTIIIMTSNVGVKEISNFGKNLGFETEASVVNEQEKNKAIIEKALKKKFKPEFLNRIDETIIFNNLKPDDIAIIIHNELDKLRDRIKELNFDIKVHKTAIDYLVKVGYDEAYGARPLNRAIQKYIEDPMTDEILTGNFKEGDIIKITYDKKTNKIVLS